MGLLHKLSLVQILDGLRIASACFDHFSNELFGDHIERLKVFLLELLKKVFLSFVQSLLESILHEDAKEGGLFLKILLELLDELLVLLDESVVELVGDGSTDSLLLNLLQCIRLRLSLIVIFHHVQET